MVFILQLPKELIDNIAELAEPKDSLTLSSVCRLFNAIATPHAYRQVSLRSSTLTPTSRILPFLRTVLDRPTVGAYVRDLSTEFLGSLTRPPPFKFRDLEPFPEELRKFAEYSASRGLSSEIEAALTIGSIGAMLFLLICHLPSLRTLDINPSKGTSSNLFFRQIHLTPTLPCGLQSLRSITFSNARRLSLNMITPFLGLTNITAVHCVSAFLEHPEQPGADSVSERTANGRVEVIHLVDCLLDPESLAALVEYSRALKSFIYRHDATYPDVHFSASPFMHAIRHARDSLENLELDFAFDRMQFVGSPGSLGPLCDFTALKHISASIPLLLAEPWQAPGLATVLPPSLASLTLWIARDSKDRGWESVVVQLLEDKKGAVLLLKRLCVVSCFDYTEDETIRGACIQAEVKVTFLSGRVSPPWAVDLDTLPDLVELPDGDFPVFYGGPVQPVWFIDPLA